MSDLGPLVVVPPWWSVKRWDGTQEGADECKTWPVLPLLEALEQVHATDAMVSAALLPGEARMPLLKGVALRQESCQDVTAEVMIFDIDPPKGSKSDGFKIRTREAVEDLAFDEDCGWWETQRGYRVVIWLDKKIGPDDWESVWWGYRDWLLQREISADTSARDFTRVMRLPNVNRQDEKFKGTITGDFEMPTRKLPWIIGEPPRDLMVRSRGGLRGLAKKKLLADVDRNVGLFRILGAFHRLGLSREAQKAALWQIDLDICEPPIQLMLDPSSGGEPELETLLDKIEKYPFGDIMDLIGGRPGTDMELELGSQSEIGDWVLSQIEGGDLGVRVVWDEGVLRKYDPVLGIWVEVPDVFVDKLVMDLDGCWVGEGRGRRRLKVGENTLKGVWRLIQSKRSQPGWFGAKTPGVVVNGVRHCISGEEKPAAVFRDTWALETEEKEGSVLWKQFIQWFTVGDSAMQDLLAEWVGGVLFGVSTKFQKAFLFHGPGANGKSVFLKVVRGLLPPEAVCSVDPSKLEEEYWRARLKGKMLNVVTEMSSGGKRGGGHEAFKSIICGDVIGAREPAGRPFDLVPRAGHGGACNTLPNVGDFTDGFWRKWIAIPCEARIPDGGVVGELEERLIAECGSVIVRWAVTGARRLIDQGGYSSCARSSVLGEEWRADADQVREFLSDFVSESKTISLQGIYDSYRIWVEGSGSGRLARKTFKARLDLITGGQHRIKDARGTTPRMYLLKPPTDASDIT